MNIIIHRRNTLNELNETPERYGVEVDVRSYGKELIVHHEPYVEGVLFEVWISNYRHGTLILNVKEEGLEQKLILIMQAYGINDFFFLDQSFPYLIKWSKAGESRCAVRFSEYESIETVMALSGKVKWVWVDCFSRFPLTNSDARYLKTSGFKLCLVSPELQGRNAEDEIPVLANFLIEHDIKVDAICSKRPDIWEIVFKL